MSDLVCAFCAESSHAPLACHLRSSCISTSSRRQPFHDRGGASRRCHGGGCGGGGSFDSAAARRWGGSVLEDWGKHCRPSCRCHHDDAGATPCIHAKGARTAGVRRWLQRGCCSGLDADAADSTDGPTRASSGRRRRLRRRRQLWRQRLRRQRGCREACSRVVRRHAAAPATAQGGDARRRRGAKIGEEPECELLSFLFARSLNRGAILACTALPW